MAALPLLPIAVLIDLLLSPHLAVRRKCAASGKMLAQSRCLIKILGEKNIKRAREGMVLGLSEVTR